MAKQQIFKPGDIVQSTATKVFVTGEGDPKIGYPCFAGILIENDTTKGSEDWPLGMFSDTWTLSAFEKVKMTNGNKVIQGIFEKAAKWDTLDNDISKFYFDEEGNELEGSEGGDLGDIGEAAAAAFGYL